MSIPTYDPSNEPGVQRGSDQQQQFGQLDATKPAYAQPVNGPNTQQQQYGQQQPFGQQQQYGQQQFYGPQQQYGQQQFYGPQQPPYVQGYAQSPRQAKNGIGVAALVVGILSIFANLLLFMGLVGGIVAVVLGILGRKAVGRGEATNGGVALAGIITGVVGVVLSITLITVIVVAFFVSGAGTYMSCVSNANGDQTQIQRCDIQFQRSS